MTNEYICKQDAVNAVPEELKVDFMDEFGAGFNSCRNEMLGTVEALPPADVAPVVRCKDCEWATKSTELSGWYMCKCEEAFDYYAKPDDFCSHGKRREEEE